MFNFFKKAIRKNFKARRDMTTQGVNGSETDEFSFFSADDLPDLYRDLLDKPVSLDKEPAKRLQEALKRINKRENPEAWAKLAYSLATNYYYGALESRDYAQIELCIELITEVINTQNEHTDSERVINCKNVLANSYAIRTHGEKWRNIEHSIKLLEECYAHPELEHIPELFASICKNLSQSYLERDKGVFADNIERALLLLEDAIIIISETKNPLRHAELLHSLAYCYQIRVRGSEDRNARDAILAYERSRHIRSQKLGIDLPISVDEWQLRLNFSNHEEEARGETERPKQTIADHIKSLRKKLSELDIEKDPLSVLNGHLDIANRLLMGSPSSNEKGSFCERISAQFDEAITELDIAQEVASKYHITGYDLRILYDRKRAYHLKYMILILNNEHSVSLVEAVTFEKYPHPEFLEKILDQTITTQKQIHDRLSIEADIRSYLKHSVRLGELYVEKRSWDLATSAFEKAKKAMVSLMAEPEAPNPSTIDLLESYTQCAAYLPLVKALNGELLEAVVEADSARALMISKAISSRRMVSDEGIKRRITSLSIELNEAELKLASPLLVDRQSPLERIFEIQEEFKSIFSETRISFETSWPDLEKRLFEELTEHKVLIIPCFTGIGGIAIAVWITGSHVNLEQINICAAQTLSGVYKDFSEWRSGIVDGLLRYEEENQSLYAVGEAIGKEFYSHIYNWFSAHQCDEINQIVVLSSGGLSSLPLSIARTNGHLLLEKYSLSFITNIRDSNQLGFLDTNDPKLVLGVISDPIRQDTDRLIFSAVEAKFATSLVSNTFVAETSEATQANTIDILKNSNIWHFACHAESSTNNLFDSRILLAGHDELSFRFIADNLDLPVPELVVLSACETGVYGEKLADEFTGLAGAFLHLGAKGVVASLWKISDLASCILISAFYENLFTGQMLAPNALRKAQMLIRNSTKSDLSILVDQWNSKGRLDAVMAQRLQRAIDKEDSEIPFHEPYYWSSFVYYGF